MGSTGKAVKETANPYATPINEFANDGSITMNYVHINNGGRVVTGEDYGQDLEPAGEYMNFDDSEYKINLPNYEYGTIHFENPLILEWKNTRSTGWKKDLSEMFGNKKGKALSKAIIKAGYDAVMTWEMFRGKRVWSEIVNLNGKKV